MSEWERECEEYGCSPILAQWGNVVDMLMAQTEPKNKKKRGKNVGKINGVRCVLKTDGIIPQNVGVISTKIRAMENKIC